MTLQELINKARVELFDEYIGDDTDEDKLWSDSTLTDYINEAQRLFAERTLSIPDKVEITLEADTRDYTFSEKIIEIWGGYLEDAKRRLQVRDLEGFERSWLLHREDLKDGGYWERQKGIPRAIITNMILGNMSLWPIPVVVDTMILYVYRYPDTLVNTTDVSEIDNQFIDGLMYKVKSLALGKLDADTANLEKSMLFGQKWESFIQDTRAMFDQKFRRVTDGRPTVR